MEADSKLASPNWALGAFSLLGAGPSAIADAHIKLFRHIGEVNRGWFDRVQETANAEMDISARMFRCSSPREAADVYQQWVSERAAIFADDCRKFTQMWTELGTQFAQLGATKAVAESKDGRPN